MYDLTVCLAVQMRDTNQTSDYLACYLKYLLDIYVKQDYNDPFISRFISP